MNAHAHTDTDTHRHRHTQTHTHTHTLTSLAKLMRNHSKAVSERRLRNHGRDALLARVSSSSHHSVPATQRAIWTRGKIHDVSIGDEHECMYVCVGSISFLIKRYFNFFLFFLAMFLYWFFIDTGNARLTFPRGPHAACWRWAQCPARSQSHCTEKEHEHTFKHNHLKGVRRG